MVCSAIVLAIGARPATAQASTLHAVALAPILNAVTDRQAATLGGRW